jgi:thioredoxin reductase (NADPH)
MTDHYQVTVVGGGPAGLTAALYTTRLGHDTAVINRGGGRAAMMLDTHNVIGVTEETSGNEFLATAIEQVKSYGADYFQDYVSDVEPIETDGGDGYRVTAGNVEVTTDHVVLATGFSDARPDPPLPRTGKGLHYCLHCDAYMFVDESVFVMGTGDSAAHVAMIMLNFTPDVDILTRGDEIEWSDETAEMLENHPIDIVHEEIAGMQKDDDGWLSAFEFEDGTVREYRGGFPMYGSEYNTDLAESLGVELNDDGTIAVDDHGRTNVDGVYAVGDVTPGHNQIPTAMGEGARCGIGNHYDLRAFPRDLDAIEELGPVTEADVPAISRELLRHAVAHEGHPGGPRGEKSVAGDD